MSLSKAGQAEELQQGADSERTGALRRLYASMMLSMSSVLMLREAKLLVYLEHYRGDTASIARLESRSMAIMGSSAFLTSPLCSAMADSTGVKTLMMLCAFWSLGLRAVETFLPTAKTMFATTSLAAVSAASAQAVMTAIGDLFPGDSAGAGAALALLTPTRELGVVIGTMLGGPLAARSLRLTFATSGLFVLVQVAVISQMVEKVRAERTPLTAQGVLKAVNPFQFLRLFSSGPGLAITASAHFCQAMSERMLIGNFLSMVFMERFGWDAVKRSRYFTLASAMTLPGGLIARVLLQRLGARGALLFSVGVGAIDSLLCSQASSGRHQAAIALLALLQGASSPASSVLMLEAGTAAGVSRGEIWSGISSLMQAAILVAPAIWARWYGYCARHKAHQRFFVALAVVKVLQLGLVAATPQPKTAGPPLAVAGEAKSSREGQS